MAVAKKKQAPKRTTLVKAKSTMKTTPSNLHPSREKTSLSEIKKLMRKRKKL